MASRCSRGAERWRRWCGGVSFPSTAGSRRPRRAWRSRGHRRHRRDGDAFRLRWFAPRKEVSLCGHATLASAFVLFNELGYAGEVVRFETLSGPLLVRRAGELLSMDFPAKTLQPATDAEVPLLDAFGVRPLQVFAVVPGRSLVAVYEDEETVRAIQPDFARLTGPTGITAPGRDSDCASRYFHPAAGVPEDPVTGSSHCCLGPYWGEKLGKTEMTAYQASERGGVLKVRLGEGRVFIAGQAVTVMKSEILRTYDTIFDWRSGIIVVILSAAVLAFVIFAWDKASGLSAEERREIGVLKAIGWDTGDVLALKGWEGAAVSLTAFLAGTLLAYAHVFFAGGTLFVRVMKGWSVLYPDFRLVPAVDPHQVALLLVLTVLPYAAATVLPTWRAATVDPDAIMRS